MRRADPRFAWGLALLGTALTAAILRRGTEISFDGWVYWQGSVSILEGLGYRDFRGEPIQNWPPLYPLCLAALQSLLGTSARAVIASTALLTGAAILGFTVLIARYARERGAGSALWPAAIYAAVILVLNARDVRAENLFHALLPWLVLSILAATSERTRGRLFARSAAIAVILAACLLARNACLAFVPAVAVTLAVRGSAPAWTRVSGAALATLPAVCVWAGVRWFLGQTQSHAIDVVGAGPAVAHGIALLRGIDRNTNLDFVGLPLLIACSWAMIRRDRHDPTAPGRGASALLLVAVAGLGLVTLFSLIPIADEPRKRFTLFVTLVIGGLGMVDLRETLPRRWYLAIAALLLIQPSARVAKHAVNGRGPALPDHRREALATFLPANAVISVDHVGAEPRPLDGRVLVSPP